MKIISSSFVPYYLRSDLTVTEIEAIGSYQDLYPNNVQKTDWEFTIPSHWRNKSWCYAINSYCRFPEFSKILNEKERQSIEQKIRSIDSAIQKSRIENDYFIFKGFYETEKFNTKIFGSNYADKAFGSFSLRMDQALKYTNPVKPILFQLFLETGSNALLWILQNVRS